MRNVAQCGVAGDLFIYAKSISPVHYDARYTDGRHVCSVPLGANRRSDLLGTLPVMIRAHSIASGNTTKGRWKCRLNVAGNVV
jgi:hypothetical protein